MTGSPLCVSAVCIHVTHEGLDEQEKKNMRRDERRTVQRIG